MASSEQLAHASSLIRSLYERRPEMCDVQIQCDDDSSGNQVVILAHRAILAAKCRYFWDELEGQRSDADRALAWPPPAPPPGPLTPQQHAALSPSYTVPVRNLEVEDVPMGDALPPLRTRLSAALMHQIVQFLYLGQLRMLEVHREGPFSDEGFDVITRLLAWGIEHGAVGMADHILGHMRRCPLTLRQAAQLLELDADSSAPAAEGDGGAAGSEHAAAQLRELRQRALECIESTQLNEDTFLELTRTGLLLALQLCVFQVNEIVVVRAVQRWVRDSAWVRNAYGGAPMPPTHAHMLMLFVDPACLTPTEFAEVDDLFLPHIQDAFWSRFLKDPAVLAHGRMGKPRCEDRTKLLPAEAGAGGSNAAAAGAGNTAANPSGYPDLGSQEQSEAFRLETWAQTRTLRGDDAAPQSGGGDAIGGGGAVNAPHGVFPMNNNTSTSLSSGPGASRSITNAPSSQRWCQIVIENTGVEPPDEESIDRHLPPAQVRQRMHEQAHANAHQRSSVFITGNHFIASAQNNGAAADPAAPISYVLSVDSVSYQGVIYRGSIKSGRMMWSCNIVRNCEMFWFGVTANITRDPASFIAIDPSTWMVSDEAFCLEHCRAYTKGAGARMLRRIVVLDQAHFTVSGLPAANWQGVAFELNAKSGDLWISINQGGEQGGWRHLFTGLPTQQRLYPCMMAINKGQLLWQLHDVELI